MRLDNVIVRRGLVESRTKAQRLIRSGGVSISGEVVTKVSAQVSTDDVLVLEKQNPFVGRGALKLLAALDFWKTSVQGRIVLDIGASTGGFTQVLLERGARSVVALDVGHGQLHPSLKDNHRILLHEGQNVKNISSDWWTEKVGILPDLVTCDVSFISLTKVLSPVIEAVGRSDWIALVKPQFEAGRKGVKNGVVVSPRLREAAIFSVSEAAAEVGLWTAGLIASPIRGDKGNREYLIWLSPTQGCYPSQWKNRIHELAFSELGGRHGPE